jgi:hypothetical protein
MLHDRDHGRPSKRLKRPRLSFGVRFVELVTWETTMDYQYDAFFSYKRDRESDAWHEKVKAKLEYWLRQELQKLEVRIFFDTEEIRTGMRWQQKLSSALKQSRCIICLWSPLYFQSKWCVSEWMTFVEREAFIERDTKSHADLVMPASYFDGETFPATTKAWQSQDFSEFASTMPKFWDTELAVKFENERLRRFAHDLAEIIRKAPPYSDAFPVVEVEDRQVESEQPIGRPGNV